MSRLLHQALTIAVIASATAVGTLYASAQTKISYDQAWAKCQAAVKSNPTIREGDNSAARYTVGSACMKRYGYSLKK